MIDDLMLPPASVPSPNPSPTPVRVAAWNLPWLRHGFSTRHGGISTIYKHRERTGDLNLGWTKEDTPENVEENRRRFTEAVGVGEFAGLVMVRQVHSPKTLVLRSAAEIPQFVEPDGRALQEADGLITNVAGVLLAVQTADCVPVLVVDPVRRVVGAFHAGWRGTVARIVESGVAAMEREFGSRAEDLLAAIGPSIGACCYTVGEEVHGEFSRNFSYAEMLFRRAQMGAGEHTIDLWEANRLQLLDAGVCAENITVVGECTGCAGLPGPHKYFSHRMENGFTGRMLSAIGMVETPHEA